MRHGISDRHGACRAHDGVDAKVRVPPTAGEDGGNIHVALAGRRVDVGGGAAVRALRHFETDGTCLDLAPEEVEFGPGGQAVDDEVWPEAADVDWATDRALEFAHRGQVDDVDV